MTCTSRPSTTDRAGKITNCQIGVFAAYVSCHGHAFIDRTLYLPKTWTGAPARMAAAHVPPATAFATKPQLAREMIQRAIAADVGIVRKQVRYFVVVVGVRWCSSIHRGIGRG